MNEIAHIKEAFTELAPEYSKTMDQELIQFWGISYLEFIEQLVKTANVQTSERVLDIATGTAVIPIKLSSSNQHQDQIIGLDITPAMLMQGKKVIARDNVTRSIQLVCASAMDMPFADGIFDVIICGLGTHHMNVPKMLAESKRLLGINGRIIISDVGATAFWRSILGKILIRLLMFQYGFVNRSARSQAELEAFQNVRTAQEWSVMLQKIGFSKVQIKEIKPRLPWFPSGLTLQAVIAA